MKTKVDISKGLQEKIRELENEGIISADDAPINDPYCDYIREFYDAPYYQHFKHILQNIERVEGVEVGDHRIKRILIPTFTKLDLTVESLSKHSPYDYFGKEIPVLNGQKYYSYMDKLKWDFDSKDWVFVLPKFLGFAFQEYSRNSSYSGDREKGYFSSLEIAGEWGVDYPENIIVGGIFNPQGSSFTNKILHPVYKPARLARFYHNGTLTKTSVTKENDKKLTHKEVSVRNLFLLEEIMIYPNELVYKNRHKTNLSLGVDPFLAHTSEYIFRFTEQAESVARNLYERLSRF